MMLIENLGILYSEMADLELKFELLFHIMIDEMRICSHFISEITYKIDHIILDFKISAAKYI